MATRSRPLGDGLTSDALTELLAPHDPLLDPDSWIFTELGAYLDFAYIASRLLAGNNAARAAKLAAATQDPVDRALIQALGYSYNGEQERRREVLESALRLEPDNQQVIFELISDALPAIALGQASEETLRLAARLRGPAAAVVAGWPLGHAQNWQGIADLDAELARSNVTDLWYPETVLLRAEWRTKVVNDDSHAFNALRMLDRALVIQPEIELYVLRAAAAAVLEDREAFVETGRYVAAFIRDALDRAQNGKHVISEFELDIMEQRLAGFVTTLQELEGDHIAARRGREVEDSMRELLSKVRALSDERARTE